MASRQQGVTMGATQATELQRCGFTVVKNALTVSSKQLSEWSDDVFVSQQPSQL